MATGCALHHGHRCAHYAMTWLGRRAELGSHMMVCLSEVGHKPSSQWNLQPCWTL